MQSAVIECSLNARCQRLTDLGAWEARLMSPCASTQLRPRRVELCGVGLRVVPVAEHPGQFMTLQADHHRAVGGDAAGMVNLPRQKEGNVAWPLDPALQGFELWGSTVGGG